MNISQKQINNLKNNKKVYVCTFLYIKCYYT